MLHCSEILVISQDVFVSTWGMGNQEPCHLFSLLKLAPCDWGSLTLTGGKLWRYTFLHLDKLGNGAKLKDALNDISMVCLFLYPGVL